MFAGFLDIVQDLARKLQILGCTGIIGIALKRHLESIDTVPIVSVANERNALNKRGLRRVEPTQNLCRLFVITVSEQGVAFPKRILKERRCALIVLTPVSQTPLLVRREELFPQVIRFGWGRHTQ